MPSILYGIKKKKSNKIQPKYICTQLDSRENATGNEESGPDLQVLGILTFSAGNHNQSSVNEHSVGEMLRHTNTGRVSELNVTHFRRERERGISVEEGKTQKEGFVIPLCQDR